MRPISGFSKLTKNEKINYIVQNYLNNSNIAKNTIKSFWHEDESSQKILDEFSENTITNFAFPYGVVPNVLINNKMYCVPMVIEESSVVAAAAKSAKFWLDRGGFQAEIVDVKKVGQVHFIWNGNPEDLENLFINSKTQLIEKVKPLCLNMEKRGGGLLDLKLINKTDLEEGYFQIWADFNTCDAMGANFINSVLEALGQEFKLITESELNQELQVIMAILSNYTPDCLVKVWVECPIEELNDPSFGMSPEEFADKFARAVRIAKIDTNRATTHNKGIFNGIDSVILATGNDFRAVEACGHTFAARDGQYRGLTNCSLENGQFRFELELPLSIGTVGGLTALHPMAKTTLDILGNPDAKDLMKITATIGLAQNFSALRSLVTTGIQKGHMKMHLMNILNHLEANEEEREAAKLNFEDKVISFQLVREFIGSIRNYQ
ncbi:hydroxymethylglutaryl-CoA reductase, degradative [Bacteriovoracaceae bacterium]|nr:hydroxymethylglutaryl-CoA reductase, degradative [Bacteriovoracaceae bacterium]